MHVLLSDSAEPAAAQLGTALQPSPLLQAVAVPVSDLHKIEQATRKRISSISTDAVRLMPRGFSWMPVAVPVRLLHELLKCT
jgi:hypothetical protein